MFSKLLFQFAVVILVLLFLVCSEQALGEQGNEVRREESAQNLLRNTKNDADAIVREVQSVGTKDTNAVPERELETDVEDDEGEDNNSEGGDETEVTNDENNANSDALESTVKDEEDDDDDSEDQYEDSEQADGFRVLGEDDASSEMARAVPVGCKYNLRDYSQYTIKTLPDYQIVRSRRHPYLNSGNGPARYRRNRLPIDFRSQCQAMNKSYTLSFFLKATKGLKRHMGACLAHYGSHWVDFPTISVFDCNATQIACSDAGYYHLDNSDKFRELLIVMTPPNNRKPDAYKFTYQKRKINSLWCDYYPF